jgi:hypothetical protein
MTGMCLPLVSAGGGSAMEAKAGPHRRWKGAVERA